MANIRMAYMAAHSTRARRSTPVKTAASGRRWNSRKGAEFFQSTRHGSTADACGSNGGTSYLLVSRPDGSNCEQNKGAPALTSAHSSEGRALQAGERALEEVLLLQLVQLGRAAGRAPRLDPADVGQLVVVPEQ